MIPHGFPNDTEYERWLHTLGRHFPTSGEIVLSADRAYWVSMCWVCRKVLISYDGLGWMTVKFKDFSPEF